MKYLSLVLATALAIPAVGPAAAVTAKAPFGCNASAPNVCYFRIFYTPRGSRNVVLPSGMKANIPDVQIGRDTYCMDVNRKPVNKCARKTINANNNN